MSCKNKKILLVEDEVILAINQKGSLEEYGYYLIIANTGEEAIELFRENNDIELVLMDIDLGKGMDGTEAASRILEERDVPVIFISNHTEPDVVEKTEKITSYGYIVKSSGIAVLCASIKMAFKLYDAKVNEKKKEDALFNSEMRYREITDNAASIILRMDTSGNITYFNRFAQTFFGFSHEEIIGRNVVGTIVPVIDISNQNLELMIKDIINNTEKHINNENENMCKDGTRVWIAWSNRAIRNKNGRCVEILCVGNDITRRRRNEIELYEKEQRYRTLVENQLELVCIWLPDTTLTFVNEAYCRLIGRSRQDLIGSKWVDFIPENSRSEVLKNYQDAVAARKVYSYVHEVEVKDGIRWFRWNDVPLFDEGGNLIEFQSVGHDITERKEAEDKIRDLLSEKELIIKEVHHRIRNNMSAIRALLMLQADSLKDSPAASALHETANRVQSMSRLYNKIYTSHNFKETSVSGYVSPLVDEIISNFPNSNSVKIKKEIDDFVLDVKKLQPLGIIINELLTNVMKYAFAGKSDGIINLSLKNTDKKIILVIEDNGIGIPKSIDFKNSTGLGMQLVNSLARQIGASIKLESAGGTKCVLELVT